MLLLIAVFCYKQSVIIRGAGSAVELSSSDGTTFKNSNEAMSELRTSLEIHIARLLHPVVMRHLRELR
jgi:hypothetical protein